MRSPNDSKALANHVRGVLQGFPDVVRVDGLLHVEGLFLHLRQLEHVCLSFKMCLTSVLLI